MLKIEIDLSDITQEDLLKTICFLQTFLTKEPTLDVAANPYQVIKGATEVLLTLPEEISTPAKKKQKFKPAPAPNVGVVIAAPVPAPPPKDLTFEQVVSRAMKMVQEKKIELSEFNKLLNSHGIKVITELSNHPDKLQIINEALNGY